MGKVSHKLISKLNVFSRKRQQFQHVPVPEDEEEDIEDFRTRGCEILKAISDETHKATISTITTRSKSKSKSKNDGDYSNNNHHTSSTDCDVHGIEIEFEMDWNETIQRFQEQQQQLEQQQHQQQQQMMLEIKSQGGNEDAHKRKNKVQRLKLLKRALERRRKFDNKGSFAINMVTYRDETNPCGSAEPGALPAAADAAAAAYADDRARARARARVGNKTEHDSHSSNSRYEHLGCDDRSCRSSIMTTISNDFTLKSIDEESEYCDNGNYDDNSTSSSNINININNINGNNTQSIILGIMSLGY